VRVSPQARRGKCTMMFFPRQIIFPRLSESFTISPSEYILTALQKFTLYVLHVKMSAVRPSFTCIYARLTRVPSLQRGNITRLYHWPRPSQRHLSSRRLLHSFRASSWNEPSYRSLGRFCSRRGFFTSPISQHGHLTPPKPGEECVDIIPTD
jgi:hypothetical protein